MISWNIAKKIVSSQKLSWSCLSFLFASLLLTFDDLARDGLRNPTVFHGSSNLAPYTVNISRYGCLYAIHATCVSQCTWHLRAWQWNAFVAATSAIDWAHICISINPHLQYTESTSAMHWTPILYAQACNALDPDSLRPSPAECAEAINKKRKKRQERQKRKKDRKKDRKKERKKELKK